MDRGDTSDLPDSIRSGQKSAPSRRLQDLLQMSRMQAADPFGFGFWCELTSAQAIGAAVAAELGVAC